MDRRECELIEEAKDRLRAAVRFRNWSDAEMALKALEEVEGPLARPSAYAAAQGGCEFCPAVGGGCRVCGGGLN
jgi:hypothetical protein